MKQVLNTYHQMQFSVNLFCEEWDLTPLQGIWFVYYKSHQKSSELNSIVTKIFFFIIIQTENISLIFFFNIMSFYGGGGGTCTQLHTHVDVHMRKLPGILS